MIICRDSLRLKKKESPSGRMRICFFQILGSATSQNQGVRFLHDLIDIWATSLPNDQPYVSSLHHDSQGSLATSWPNLHKLFGLRETKRLEPGVERNGAMLGRSYFQNPWIGFKVACLPVSIMTTHPTVQLLTNK